MVDRFALDQTGCIRRTRSPTPNGVPKLAPSLPPRWPYSFLKPQPGGILDEPHDRSHSSRSLQDRTTARSSRHRGCSRHRSCGLRVREWRFEWRTIHDNDARGGTFGWRLNEWKRRCRLLITSDTLDNGVNNDAARRPERRRLARLVERDRCGTRVGPLYDERLRVDRIVSRLDVTDDSVERTDLASKRSNRQSRGASGWELPIPASEPNPLVSFAVRTYMADELWNMGDGPRRPDRPRDSCPRRTTADPGVPSSIVS
jgi:hypothetical protein